MTAIVAVATPAGADPVQNEGFTLHCDAIGDVAVTTPLGNGQWTPALASDGNRVLTPYEFHVTQTFTPIGGAPESETADYVKKAPKNGRLDTCTFLVTGSSPEGTFSFGGTVLVSYTKG